MSLGHSRFIYSPNFIVSDSVVKLWTYLFGLIHSDLLDKICEHSLNLPHCYYIEELTRASKVRGENVAQSEIERSSGKIYILAWKGFTFELKHWKKWTLQDSVTPTLQPYATHKGCYFKPSAVGLCTCIPLTPWCGDASKWNQNRYGLAICIYRWSI